MNAEVTLPGRTPCARDPQHLHEPVHRYIARIEPKKKGYTKLIIICHPFFRWKFRLADVPIPYQEQMLQLSRSAFTQDTVSRQ